MDSQYDEVEEDREESRSLGSAVKILIVVVSVGVASIVGLYVHPHLVPVVTETIPEAWGAAQEWITAPVLFVLLNVVVGTLYVSSKVLSGTSKGADERPGRAAKEAAATATAVRATAAPVAAPTVPDAILDGGNKGPSASKPPTGLRARFEKTKPFTRLVRSKSEQIPPISSTKGGPARLKKAGTFEAAASPRVVVIADPPPEDAPPPPGHEEVDKKAEAFISRFYQKVKLQRLDSLLRRQQEEALASN